MSHTVWRSVMPKRCRQRHLVAHSCLPPCCCCCRRVCDAAVQRVLRPWPVPLVGALLLSLPGRQPGGDRRCAVCSHCTTVVQGAESAVCVAHGAKQECKFLRHGLYTAQPLPPTRPSIHPAGYEYLQTLLCIHSDAELERFMHGELHLGLDVTLMAGSDLPRQGAAAAVYCVQSAVCRCPHRCRRQIVLAAQQTI